MTSPAFDYAVDLTKSVLDTLKLGNWDYNRIRRYWLSAEEPDALHTVVESWRAADARFLLANGRSPHETNSSGLTALSLAARLGRVDMIRELMKGGAIADAMGMDGNIALLCAAQHGHVHVVDELIKRGATVDIEDKLGRSALWYAAKHEQDDVLQALIKHGVVVDARDALGRTTLSIAASSGEVTVIRQLIRHGAVVDSKDIFGRTALSHAAESNHIGLVQELIKSGAMMSAKDNFGRTALTYAAESGHHAVVSHLRGMNVANMPLPSGWQWSTLTHGCRRDLVADFLRPFTIEGIICSGDTVALFTAVATGDLRRASALIDRGAPVDVMTTHGRTPLFYAAQLAQTEMVHLLLRRGASVRANSYSTHSRCECETPLLLAGRAGHMKTFQALVEAGAPVNVRSGEDGETPLISAARWGYFTGVQLLVSCGGAYRSDAVDEDEYPLILGTLETMRSMCAAACEFEAICTQLVERLFAQLQDWSSSTQEVREDAVVSFSSIVFRVCRVLFSIQKQRNPLARFIVSRAATNRIRHLHEELDHIAGVLQSDEATNLWNDQYDQDVWSLRARFGAILSKTETLLEGCVSYDQKVAAATRLQHELEVDFKDREQGIQQDIKRVLDRFINECGIGRPCVPVWFILRDDLDFHDWNIVSTVTGAKLGEGKWRKTSVTVERSDLPLLLFKKAASRRHQLSHPHVANLVGACHLEMPRLFVYESTPGGQQLHNFLSEEKNRASMWKCLYEAALGLQHLHRRNVVHGALRSENIIVGADSVTKLTGIRGDLLRFVYSERSGLNWTAPEVALERRRNSVVPNSYAVGMWLSEGIALELPWKSERSHDVYALGMCIWEAITRELPWQDKSVYDIFSSLRSRSLPDRPAKVGDDQWDLIAQMCAADPSKRVDINYVVTRLKMLLYKNENRQRATTTSIPTGTAKNQVGSLDEYITPEFCQTIPKTLSDIQSRCEKLPDAKWVVDSVCPALEFTFKLLQERQKTPEDVEVVQFYGALCKLWRYLRTTGDTSVLRQARSRRVAETHHVVYAELDRLLDSLDVPKSHLIRAWSDLANPHLQISSQQGVHGEDVATSSSRVNELGKSSHGVTLSHFEAPASKAAEPPTSWLQYLREVRQLLDTDRNKQQHSAEQSHRHELWTRAGVAELFAEKNWHKSLGAFILDHQQERTRLLSLYQLSPSQTRLAKAPHWYLSLKDLTFSESGEIGEGAFGMVYKGTWLDTPVVVKFMGYEEDFDTISTDLLLHEVRVWHRLNHPHVLKLFGACHVDKRYFVCEDASGGELTKYLKKPGNEHLVWQKMYESALGLQYLHSQNVAHNDFKCDNIMVGMDGKAKLIEFGLSALLNEAEIRVDVKKMGAVNWRSPEYLAGERPSFASDVYSFAMCIIEAASGEIPWGRSMIAGQLRYQWKRGNGPNLPDSMTEKQRNLIQLMTKLDPPERVSMAFVVDKLSEIAHDINSLHAP